MKKLMSFAFLFVLLCVGVSALGNLSVSPASPYDFGAVNKSQVLTLNLTFTNTDINNSLTVNLSSSIVFNGTRTTQVVAISPSSVVVPNGSTANVSYTFTVPNTAFADTYRATLNFSDGGENYVPFPLLLTVNPSPDFTLSSSDVAVITNSFGTGTLTVTNTGNTDLVGCNALPVSDFIFGSNTFSKDKMTITPSSLSIGYGNSSTFNMTIANLALNQTPGAYTGTLNVTCGGVKHTLDVQVAVQQPTRSILFTPSTVDVSGSLGANFTTSFTLKNNGTEPLTGIRLNITGLTSFDASLNQTGPLSLVPGGEYTVGIRGTIPISADASLSPFRGNVIVTADNNVSVSLPVQISILSRLDFTSMDIYVDEDRESLSNGKTIDQIKPGQRIQIVGDIKNRFTTSEDIDIDNVDVTFTLERIDNGDDDDDTDDVGRVQAGDTEPFELGISIPDDADEDSYVGVLEAEGIDENGAVHYIAWEFTVKVERNHDDIMLLNTELNPSSVSCARDVTVEAEVANVGSNRLNKVMLQVISNSLGLNKDVRNIRLDEDPNNRDNSYATSFSFTLPDSIAPGTYPITVNAFIEPGDLGDKKDLTLVVHECALGEQPSPPVVTPPGSNTGNGGTPVIIAPDQTKPGNVNPAVTPSKQPEDASFTQTTMYVMILAGAVVVLLVLLILMLALLFKK